MLLDIDPDNFNISDVLMSAPLKERIMSYRDRAIMVESLQSFYSIDAFPFRGRASVQAVCP